MTSGGPFLRSNRRENIYSQRDGDPHSPCVDNRSMLVPGKPELRQYQAIFVVGDGEVSRFGDDITVNCAPLV